MAESKQYITQTQENGTVQISEDVIADIVAHAACEVDGVVGLNNKPGADIAEFIGKKNWGRGIKITVLENNAVNIECNINVYYGQNVLTIAKNAQAAIVNALELIACIQIESVNVNVCGITRQ